MQAGQTSIGPWVRQHIGAVHDLIDGTEQRQLPQHNEHCGKLRWGLKLPVCQKPYFSFRRRNAFSPPSIMRVISFRTGVTSIAPSILR
jgi:hypothetical protein